MVRTATYFTLSQAAFEARKSKSVISNALKNGTLSFVSKDDSGYQIDPAELFRVFPQNPVLERERERSRTPERTGQNGEENGSYISILEVENKLLHAQLIDKEERIEDLKAERDRVIEEKDRWHKQADRLLITYRPKGPELPLESEISISAGVVPHDLSNGPQIKNLTRYRVIAVAVLVASVLSLVMSYDAPEIKAALNSNILQPKEHENAQANMKEPTKTATENGHERIAEPLKESLSTYPQSYPPTP